MKTFITLGLLVFAVLTLSAQKSDRRFSERYAADFGPDEQEFKCAYQWVITKKADGSYVRRVYFPETRQLTGIQHYADRRLRKREGPSMSWSDDGKLQTDAVFHAGKLDGPYTAYHSTGEVREEGLYLQGDKAGQWSEYDRDGRLRRTAPYAAGKLDGTVVYYDTLGMEAGRVDYRDDAPARGTDTLAVHFGFAPGNSNVEERMPLFPGCEEIAEYAERKACADRKLLEFIYQTVRYPERARRYGVEGMGIVKFVLESDGTVADVEVIRGLNEDISRELIRIVELMPNWEPGTQDGVPVRVQFNLPVKFNLN